MRNNGKHAWSETTNLDDKWHHIVLVLKANNAEFTAYHDGEATVTQILNRDKGHNTGSGNVIVGSKAPVHRPLVDGVTPTGDPYAYGSVTFDELVMWNQVLSGNQVNQIFSM